MCFVSGKTAGEVWFDLLDRLYFRGANVSPRGMQCSELTDVSVRISNARNNIFYHPVRNLNYKFAVAEWLWIWFGRDDVTTIKQYNSKIAEFSNDGVIFDGAYGPHVKRQVPWVIQSLERDPVTRQAVIEIPRVYKPTKDQPCTLSLQFLIRDETLKTIVVMRSSDIWLGLPYDIFNFSMISNVLAGILHVNVGPLTLHLGSSHLYHRDREKAEKVLGSPRPMLRYVTTPHLPGSPPEWLEHTLVSRLMPFTCEQPWERYARALLSPTSLEALKEISWESSVLPTTSII